MAELENMTDKEVKEHVRDALAHLYNRDDGITYGDGSKIVLPEKYTKKKAVEVLQRSIEEDQTTVEWEKTIDYRKVDGLVALRNVIERTWGFAQGGIRTLFGKMGAEMTTVQVGFDETVDVPSGMMTVPTPHGSLKLWAGAPPNEAADGPDPERFKLASQCQKVHVSMLTQLWDQVVQELKENSIYKGEAITSDYSFVNLDAVDPDRIVLAEDVHAQVQANIFTPIRKTERCLQQGIPLKRGILLEGAYGTGKSLTGAWVAQEAVEHGWTFIKVEQGEGFAEALEFARKYEPAVLFVEDIDDQAAAGERDTGMNAILNTFDGVDKSAQVMAILTTNHVDRVHPGLLRPGRLDAVIHFGSLDLAGTREMLDVLGRDQDNVSFIADDIDVEQVHKACEDFTPAFVAEAIRKTALYVTTRNGDEGRVTTEDLVHAANQLRTQFDLMHKDRGEVAPSLDQAMVETVQRANGGD